MKPGKLIAWVALGLSACGHSQPKATRYIIDSGASGWVKITYNRPDAPELPVEEGFAVVRLPQDLRISTRNRMNPSWEGSEFYYQSPDGKRVHLTSTEDPQRRLWALEKTSDTDGDREVFFVGKEEQFTPASGATRETVRRLSGSPSAQPSAPTKGGPTPVFDPTRIETNLPK